MNYFKHSNLVYRLAASRLNQVVKSTMSHLDMTMAVAIVTCSTSHMFQTWKQDLIFWVWLLMFNLVSHSIHSIYMRSAAVNLYSQWTKNDDYKKLLARTSVSVMANLRIPFPSTNRKWNFNIKSYWAQNYRWYVSTALTEQSPAHLN